MARAEAWWARVLSLALVLAAPGCAWTIESLDNGSAIPLSGYDAVHVGEDGLGEVLDALGPPREITVKPHEEILVWRHARYAGTRLTFFLPGFGVSFNPLGGLAARMAGKSEVDERLEKRDPASLVLPLVFYSIAGAAPGSLRAEELLNLRNRRLRTSRLRVVFDRSSGRVLEKSFRDDTGRGQAWIRSTFLAE